MSSQELEKLLAELRADNRGVEAPQHLELALRGAFRAQAGLHARGKWRRWAPAAAAAILVLLGAAAWRMGEPLPPSPALRLTVAPPTPALQPAPLAETVQPLVAKRVKRTRRPQMTPVKPEPQAPEVATDFMPLEDNLTLSPIESGHVLRVQLPRSAMVRFGLPVNPDRMMEPVKADVVFAQDGIARAIRFVK
jgi:hypothetical protein